MTESPTGRNLGTWALLVAGALVAVVFIALTIATKVARGEPWLPWVILLLVNGAVVTAVTLVLQRAKKPEVARRTTMRWALVVGCVGVALISLSIFLVAGAA